MCSVRGGGDDTVTIRWLTTMVVTSVVGIVSMGVVSRV